MRTVMLGSGGRIPLLFEALPTIRDGDPERMDRHVERLGPLRGLGLAGVNVPEIINGHYQTVEPRLFAATIRKAHGLPVLLNRITVHHDAPALQRWARQTREEHGITDLVLVGGESSRIEYPGIGVLEALESLRPIASSLGTITIPTRRRPDLDEPERLRRKHAAGADHAISQILLESGPAVRLQDDLWRTGRGPGQAPLLFWSLAPVARPKDLAFLEWLGVDVPPRVRKRLLAPTAPEGRLEVSHEINLETARRLLEHAEGSGGARIGFCVEHVMQNNLPGAFGLAKRLRDLCQEFRCAQVAAVQPP